MIGQRGIGFKALAQDHPRREPDEHALPTSSGDGASSGAPVPAHPGPLRHGRGMVALLGGASWLAGIPAAAAMAPLCLGLLLASLFRHLAMRERLTPPYMNVPDEAGWFFLVGHVLCIATDV